MPQIRIIIPTYNRADFIEEAIQSVLAQTYYDFELIIVDDGSTDNTKEVISHIQDPRISYFYQENQGVSAARNAGITKASGEWLSFLDSDDYWLPQKLEEQMNYMKTHPQYRISQTQEIWIRNGKKVNPLKKHTQHAGMIYERCLPLCRITPSSVMIHRSVFDTVGLFDESLPACEDYDLWLRITHTFPVGLVRKKLIVKQGGHADQLSTTTHSLDRYRIQAMEKMLTSGLLNEEYLRATKKELRKKCIVYRNGCLKRGKNNEASRIDNLIKKWC